MKKPTVYLETTIPSYLTSRLSTDLEKYYRQVKTRQWWENVYPRVDSVISEYVLIEARKGDPEAAKKRITAIENVKRLDTSPEVIILAKELSVRLKIPKRAQLDAFHMAIAVTYEVDYLLSWNFEHIVGAPVKRTFAEIGSELGIVMPTLCTPEELMDI